MKFIRKSLSLFLVVCLMFTMSISALAATWDLSNGSIDISFVDSKQTVTQNATAQEDSNPTITSGAETSNTISVTTGAGETAQFTVDQLTINTDKSSSAIDIKDGSSAVITVQGENSLDNTASGSGDTHAAIHVGDGASLTIQGSDSGDNKLLVNENHLVYNAENAGAAGIGSNIGEDFTGEVTIEGNVYVASQATNNGAAIGSGKGSDFTGTVNIRDGAEVHVEGSANGTGIGAGYKGDFTGKVNINDATVYADTYSNGAGIGAGFKGDFTGEVTIENSDVTAISGPSGKGEGAGIGAGYAGDFSGTVSITDSTVHAQATNGGAAIGSGGLDQNFNGPTEFSGQVNIHNSDVTAKTLDEGTPIGAPDEYDRCSSQGLFTGSITITGDSTLTLIDGKNTTLGEQVLLGGSNPDSTGEVSIEEGTTVNYWTGTRDGLELNGTSSTATEEEYPKIVGGILTVVKAFEQGNPGNDQTNGTSGGASGGSYVPDTFWISLLRQIKAAAKGDKLIVNAGQRTAVPVYILDALTEHEVELTIHWNGGEDIVIPHDHGIEYNGESIPFTELLRLLEE